MAVLKGACLFAQSGGPSSVINSSAAGVFTEALKNRDIITDVYGAAHGIKGILEEDFYDISKEDIKEIMLLKTTPSSALGSVRYKMKDIEEDASEYERLLEVFRKYNIRYFFYNGGNDSMDTCNKISKFMAKSGYECRVIGVPKTIDNDLYGTDHCPGYGSAAKYVATSVMEIYRDATVYDQPTITIIEVMGRNAGWLTAAAALSNVNEPGCGADLIYLPEVVFSRDKFIEDIRKVMAEKRGKCVAVVSEGIKNKNGNYVSEELTRGTVDSFGHAQLGGVGLLLASEVKKEFKAKVRSIEFSLLQRCGAHLASKVDVEEAFKCGVYAVKFALKGLTDKMTIIERDLNSPSYKAVFRALPLEFAANTEKKIPAEWICADGTNLTDDFIKYALPLIQGDIKAPLENGLPRFARLKKVPAKK